MLSIGALRNALTAPWLSNALWKNARAVPSLDLRFADNKSLVDAKTGASLVTFTRASSGTFVGSNGVLQTAATDAPRFDHNPATGESLGLLVEEARTNLLLRSEEFGTTWTTLNASVSVDQILAPNGTLTADKLIETASTGAHYVTQVVSALTGIYTVSVYIKASEVGHVMILMVGGTTQRGVGFNLSTGATYPEAIGGVSPPDIGASAVDIGNGWWRCRMTWTADGQTSLRINTDSGTGTSSTTGTGTSGIYIWGAQLEAGAAPPTSYIPTTSATVTRAADVASITGTNFSSWYNQTEGTVFFEGINPAISTTAFAVSDGSTNNRLQMESGTNSRIARVVSGGTTQAGNGIAYTYGASQKFAMSYVTNSINFANAGTLGTEDTSATIPTVDQARIGANPTGANLLNNTIKRLTYWPVRLANPTLQSITTP